MPAAPHLPTTHSPEGFDPHSAAISTHLVPPPPTSHALLPSWARAEHGWSETSHKDKSFLGSAGAKLQRMGATLRSWWNSINQLFSRGRSSAEFFAGKEDRKADIDDLALQGGAPMAPSATVSKLLDFRGPRSGRLSPTDLRNLASSIVAGHPEVRVIDGFSETRPGDGFKAIAGRRPSEVLHEVQGLSLMPFAFPSSGFGSEEHVVLITMDPVRREIRYFDPKGLHSDAPPRQGGFDEPFNMRQDLEALQRKMATATGQPWTIKENTTSYQRDPTNCGTFVALAMRDEVAGRRVGEGWIPGENWVNGQKPGLAQAFWNHIDPPPPPA